MKRHAPELQLGQLVVRPYGLRLPLLQRIPSKHSEIATAIHPNYRFVNQAVITKAHQSGLRVNVWTANSPVDIQQMLDFGVDMIITDTPDVACGIRDARIYSA
jgi:glycerophosphoryl diester phosphodiesterase